jgi:hypothetical protein
VLALNLAMVAVLWEIFTGSAGLSTAASQVLTAAIAGIVGVLGTYVGMRVARRHDERHDPPR